MHVVALDSKKPASELAGPPWTSAVSPLFDIPEHILGNGISELLYSELL